MPLIPTQPKQSRLWCLLPRNSLACKPPANEWAIEIPHQKLSIPLVQSGHVSEQTRSVIANTQIREKLQLARTARERAKGPTKRLRHTSSQPDSRVPDLTRRLP